MSFKNNLRVRKRESESMATLVCWPAEHHYLKWEQKLIKTGMCNLIKISLRLTSLILGISNAYNNIIMHGGHVEA
jgi:hypothetical protein